MNHTRHTRHIKPVLKPLLLALGATIALTVGLPARAQVAGTASTKVVAVTELEQLAYGLSVKKSILGKTLYNDAGQKIGKVDDLIIAPDKNVSYLIVAAGGFLGMGRHDVAIPAAQVQQLGGRIVLPGASKDAVAAMPQFRYAVDTARRDELVASAQQNVAMAKAKLQTLKTKSAAAAASASAEAKASLDKEIEALDQDVKTVENKLSEMTMAGGNRWREFEAGLKTAVDRLKASMQKPQTA